MPETTEQSYYARLSSESIGTSPRGTSRNGATSMMVAQFRTFYAEVARLRQEVRERTWETSGASVPERADAMQQHLLDVLDRQEQQVHRQGGERLQERHRKARYVMTALADEIFLQMDWPGRAYWTDHLLESRLFDSQDAGERVFAMIGELLQESQSSKVDLATVYLYVLVLGFEGRYQTAREQAPLDDYRHRLYQYITRREPDRLESGVPISRNAYGHTLDRGSVQLLPDLRVWGLRLAIVGGVYLVVSTILWWYYTGDLASLAEAILAA